MRQIKEINIKNWIYYFSDDMINNKNFDPNQINIDKKSYKNIDIYYIGNITIKNLSYVSINSVNPLYLINNKVNGYIEECNRNKYLTLVFNYENNDSLKTSTELWNKIKELIRSLTNTSGYYNKKYIKIKFRW